MRGQISRYAYTVTKTRMTNVVWIDMTRDVDAGTASVKNARTVGYDYITLVNDSLTQQ